MTAKEVLDIRNNHPEIAFNGKANPDELAAVIDMALDKQIPKNPYSCKTSGGQKGHMCPRCQRVLVLGYPQYCEFCGQAIDWSEEE